MRIHFRSKEKGVPRVLNMSLNTTLPKEGAPLFRENATTSLKRFAQGMGIIILLSLSKGVGDDALPLIGLNLSTLINIHTLSLNNDT